MVGTNLSELLDPFSNGKRITVVEMEQLEMFVEYAYRKGVMNEYVYCYRCIKRNWL